MPAHFLLKDAIRWICRDGNLVLQVLRTEGHGTKEIWDDVPIVFEESQKFCECPKSHGEDAFICIDCGLPYKRKG